MNVFEKITVRTKTLSDLLNQAKADARQYQDQLNVLAVYKKLQETGLAFGDRFVIKGRNFGQDNANAILTGHRNGSLVGLIIGVNGNLTKNDFVLSSWRTNDVERIGPDALGTPYLNPNFDPSALLNGEEEADEVS